jgi:hypothetical protein
MVTAVQRMIHINHAMVVPTGMVPTDRRFIMDVSTHSSVSQTTPPIITPGM